MHARTIERLEQLEKASWFSRVGVNEGPEAAAVGSWPEAIEQCTSYKWEDLQLEALNQYRVYIAERWLDRLNLWNDLIDEVKSKTSSLVDRKIAEVLLQNHLPKRFGDQVRHDIMLCCMETEYADICPLGFFTHIGSWYMLGHFPCGWLGAFPNGKFVIY